MTETTEEAVTELTWATADAADGPKIAKYIRENYKPQLHDTVGRRLRDWEDGARASVFSIDRMLVTLGGNLSEVPDDVWVEGPAHPGAAGTGKNRAARKTRAQKAQEARPPKFCQRCGDAIPQRTPCGKFKSPSSWATATFCGVECAQRAGGQWGRIQLSEEAPVKVCRQCDRGFSRREGERPSAFQKKRFCTKSCAAKFKRNLGRHTGVVRAAA